MKSGFKKYYKTLVLIFCYVNIVLKIRWVFIMQKINLNDEERTECEIWTRVMGYYRPISGFNKGKKSEYADRKCFCEKVCVNKMSHDKKSAA